MEYWAARCRERRFPGLNRERWNIEDQCGVVFFMRMKNKGPSVAQHLLAEKQAKAFQDGVPGARVIRLRSTHYIFISNESDVLREMCAFMGGLK